MEELINAVSKYESVRDLLDTLLECNNELETVEELTTYLNAMYDMSF